MGETLPYGPQDWTPESELTGEDYIPVGTSNSGYDAEVDPDREEER